MCWLLSALLAINVWHQGCPRGKTTQDPPESCISHELWRPQHPWSSRSAVLSLTWRRWGSCCNWRAEFGVRVCTTGWPASTTTATVGKSQGGWGSIIFWSRWCQGSGGVRDSHHSGAGAAAFPSMGSRRHCSFRRQRVSIGQASRPPAPTVSPNWRDSQGEMICDLWVMIGPMNLPCQRWGNLAFSAKGQCSSSATTTATITTITTTTGYSPGTLLKAVEGSFSLNPQNNTMS